MSLLKTQQQFNYQLIILGDPDMLAQRAKSLSLNIPFQLLSEEALESASQTLQTNTLNILPIYCNDPVIPGVLKQNNAAYVMAMLDKAIELCQKNICQAMVTCPIQKSILIQAGFAIQGHTEYLAERCGVNKVVMMLANEHLRVALATTHIPLKEVPQNITRQSLLETLEILDQDLQLHFGISEPQIYVCGLNPHAGEAGKLGTEEQDIIEPTLNELRAQGLHLHGPLPADTIFNQENRKHADAFLAMYHDQGLPVLKALGFGDSINITLGLPIIRSSVDHGTALSLAGSGKASNQSLLHAIAYAQRLAKKKYHV